MKKSEKTLVLLGTFTMEAALDGEKGVDMHLMDGPYGASTDKAKSLKGNDYSFKTIQELFQRLYARNPNMFSKEFSLEDVETYIQQAQMDLNIQKIVDNPANFGLGAIAQIEQSVSYQDRTKGQKN